MQVGENVSYYFSCYPFLSAFWILIGPFLISVASLPPSVLLRQVAGSMFPVYILNVRVLKIEPCTTGLFRSQWVDYAFLWDYLSTISIKFSDVLQFVRGHCAYYSCNAIIKNIVWTDSGPLTFGKLARPYCPECCQISKFCSCLSLAFFFFSFLQIKIAFITVCLLSRTEEVS